MVREYGIDSACSNPGYEGQLLLKGVELEEEVVAGVELEEEVVAGVELEEEAVVVVVEEVDVVGTRDVAGSPATV